MDKRALSLRIAAAERGGDEQRAGHVGSRDPEDHRLQVPGAEQVAREHSRQVEAIEVAGLGTIVRDRAADQHLREEEQAGDHHELHRGGLGRRDLRRRTLAGGCGRRRASVPAEVVELAEGEQHDRDAAEQEHQADGAPQQRAPVW